MFFALQSRLPALFRFRCSMPPRAAALRSRSASHASSSAPAALRSTSSAAPSSKSEVVLLFATSPPHIRRVSARTPGRRHRRVACSRSQAGPRVVELQLQLPGSAAKDLAEDRTALLALRGALDRGGVLPWVHEELRGGKAPQQQERRLPLLSFGEAIEDRRGTGFPALNRGSGGGGTGGGGGTRAWGRCKIFFSDGTLTIQSRVFYVKYRMAVLY